MAAQLVLNVSGLTIEFRSGRSKTKAVDNLSFSLEKGKTLGIVGESGSGKSVTSLAIMRLLSEPPGKITATEISLLCKSGKEVSLLSLQEKEMRKIRGNEIAMIFQEPMTSLNPVYRCGKQVAEAVRLHKRIGNKEAKEETLKWFEEVMLPDPDKVWRAYPHELSGGQKQRVMIAMAMSCNPAILIADEPTTALDVTVQKNILELMRQLQQKYGMSIIFISHDLGVISEIANEGLVMHQGKLVESGPISELFNNPQHPYTQGLIACRPPLNRRPAKLMTVGDFLSDDNSVFGKTRLPLQVVNISSEERLKRHKILYNNSPLLSVRKLSKHFFVRSKKSNNGIFKAVNNVSFDVYPGETIGLVGESGCGKTTLGRAILRLIEPTSGQVIYDGTDVTLLSRRHLRTIRRNIQIIFQDPYSSLNPRMSIGAAIMEPMAVHMLHGSVREKRSKVIELLQRVGLKEDHYFRYPHEFSGGQRQRIGIARALAVSPSFIICDESVSALDVSVQAQVLNLLNDLKRDFGFTYIFISHDLAVVRYMSDRMLIMKDGEIIESGEADNLYSNPTEDYTRRLIEAIPIYV